MSNPIKTPTQSLKLLDRANLRAENVKIDYCIKCGLFSAIFQGKCVRRGHRQ